MMIVNVLLALLAYSIIIFLVVYFVRGVAVNNRCNQDCRQGRDCDCEDEC